MIVRSTKEPNAYQINGEKVTLRENIEEEPLGWRYNEYEIVLEGVEVTTTYVDAHYSELLAAAKTTATPAPAIDTAAFIEGLMEGLSNG